MIKLKHADEPRRRLGYMKAFSAGKIIHEVEAMEVDEDCTAPIWDLIMEQLGGMGIFGRER